MYLRNINKTRINFDNKIIKHLCIDETFINLNELPKTTIKSLYIYQIIKITKKINLNIILMNLKI